MVKDLLLRPSGTRILLILLFLPLLAWAQVSATDTLAENHNMVQMLGLITPMAVSPYLTLFLSCAASTFGLGGGYIEANPALNNPYLVWISLILFLLTLVPNMSKASKPLGLAVSYLEEYSVFVIYAIIFIVPVFTALENTNTTGYIHHLGIFNLDASDLVFICISIPVLMVILTVRLFLDILIFISPIPLLDSAFELIKMGFSTILFVIYLLFPALGVVLGLMIFFIAFIFYKRAKAQLNYFRYLFLDPIIRIFRKKSPVMLDEEVPEGVRDNFSSITMAVQGITLSPLPGIKEKSRIWLIASGNKTYICTHKWYSGDSIYEMKAPLRLNKEFYAVNVYDGTQTQIQLSVYYLPLYNQIIQITGGRDEGLSGIADIADSWMKKGMARLNQMTAALRTTRT